MTKYGPDFICIGSQKAGTSWLYENVLIHPDMFMPPEKEVNFFCPRSKLKINTIFRKLISRKERIDYLRRWNKAEKISTSWSGIQCLYWRFSWYLRYLYANHLPSQYSKLFLKLNGKKSGDISPTYAIFTEKQIKKLSKAAPQAKIIFLIRNPIERTWSHFKMETKNLNALSEDEILHRLQTRVTYFSYLSIYTAILKRWERFFPNQIRVWFYDQLNENPVQLFQEICEYLEITPTDIVITDKVFEGPHISMPKKAYSFLAFYFENEIKELHKIFNNQYTKRWMEKL